MSLDGVEGGAAGIPGGSMSPTYESREESAWEIPEHHGLSRSWEVPWAWLFTVCLQLQPGPKMIPKPNSMPPNPYLSFFKLKNAFICFGCATWHRGS